MPAAARRARTGRARAEAPASAAETAAPLRSAIGKKARLGTTIAIATLADTARASPEKGAKPVARGGSAPRARSSAARSRTAPNVARNERRSNHHRSASVSARRTRAPSTSATSASDDAAKPAAARVYVLTYFFSSLTIDKQRALGVPFGWLGSAAAEWLGVPICHSNVQVQSLSDPADVVEFGFEGGARRGTGVYQCCAGANPHLAFTRQTRCYLGETSLRHKEIVQVLDDLKKEWSSDSYHLLTKNCNHFCDALVRRLVPGKKMPAYVNRGARLLCALPAPFPGALPKCVSKFLPSGGSWTAGAVCAMAERERRLAGVRDFRLRSDWDGEAGDEKERFFEKAGDENPVDASEARFGKTRVSRVDPLAAHLKPVPLVGEHVWSWAF
jgi:hypothetical protein